MPNPNDLQRYRDGTPRHFIKLRKQLDESYLATTEDGKITGSGEDEIAALKACERNILEFYRDAQKDKRS